ncbi:hypothetical protein J6590_005933 [Homalodisca vitripennis]|nr:hypothetical protein J6590_005933 [Homalodisca vitripennis]
MLPPSWERGGRSEISRHIRGRRESSFRGVDAPNEGRRSRCPARCVIIDLLHPLLVFLSRTNQILITPTLLTITQRA